MKKLVCWLAEEVMEKGRKKKKGKKNH